MKDYLTIGEFAKLRNVNINSLIYYEKLGILCPAYVDPKTHYRYYAPEQLSSLDIIQLCLQLDIPLRNLRQYQDENGYWQKKMLEDGRQIVKDKIEQMQEKLDKIEYSMKCQEDQDHYAYRRGIYQRVIPSRFFIVEEYFDPLNSLTRFGRISTALFDYAQEKGLSVVLPTGFMFVFNKDTTRRFLFYDVLPTEKKDEKIIHIPETSFSCLQIPFKEDRHFRDFLTQQFGPSDRRLVIVSNLIRATLQKDSRYNEIQVLDGDIMPILPEKSYASFSAAK